MYRCGDTAKAYFLAMGLAHPEWASSNHMSSVCCPFIVYHMTSWLLGGMRLHRVLTQQLLVFLFILGDSFSHL